MNEVLRITRGENEVRIAEHNGTIQWRLKTRTILRSWGIWRGNWRDFFWRLVQAQNSSNFSIEVEAERIHRAGVG